MKNKFFKKERGINLFNDNLINSIDDDKLNI